MASGIREIKSKKKLLAIIIKATFEQRGLKFFVPDEYPQQLGYMRRPKGYTITPHIHSSILRKIRQTQETLFIRSGKVRIDFYDETKHYIESRVVCGGDVVFVASGGHGFEFLEESEIIEVKQGPFLKEAGLVRFEPAHKIKLKLKLKK